MTSKAVCADDLAAILKKNPLTMRVLEQVALLGLPDWAVGAGFVRNQVWDYLHGFAPTQAFTDIDVIFFDAKDTGTSQESAAEQKLGAALPGMVWEVRNQARMHLKKEHAPYTDMADGIRNWTETATAVAVRLSAGGELEFIAPWGLDDLRYMVMRPTPHGREVPEIYLRRIDSKGWKTRWPRLTVIEP